MSFVERVFVFKFAAFTRVQPLYTCNAVHCTCIYMHAVYFRDPIAIDGHSEWQVVAEIIVNHSESKIFAI